MLRWPIIFTISTYMYNAYSMKKLKHDPVRYGEDSAHSLIILARSTLLPNLIGS